MRIRIENNRASRNGTSQASAPDLVTPGDAVKAPSSKRVLDGSRRADPNHG
jgi:hypothetical protein